MLCSQTEEENLVKRGDEKSSFGTKCDFIENHGQRLRWLLPPPGVGVGAVQRGRGRGEEAAADRTLGEGGEGKVGDGGRGTDGKRQRFCHGWNEQECLG